MKARPKSTATLHDYYEIYVQIMGQISYYEILFVNYCFR